MKSITARLQEVRDIGKIEEDGTTFNNVAKALNSIGISALDTEGQLRPLQEIFDELGPQWASLSRNHKAYIATTLAGNRQQSRFIALMDNYDRALELTEVSQNATGESAKQLRALNQGLEASLTNLKKQWQEFATTIANSSIIKGAIDLLGDLLEFINALPDGLVQTITYFKAATIALEALTQAGQNLKSKGINIGQMFGLESTGAAIQSLIPGTSKLGAQYKEGKKANLDGMYSGEGTIGAKSGTSLKVLGKVAKSSDKPLRKLGATTAELGKSFNFTNAAAGAMWSTIASMAGSALGLADDEAEGLSRLGAIMPTLASMGPKGVAVGLGITAIAYAFDKVTISVEEAKQRLEATQRELDEVSQKHDNIENSLSTYTELSGKLSLSTEETEDLRAASETLAQALPTLVSGYDAYGNAIINASGALRELKGLQAQEASLSGQVIDDIGQISISEGTDFWKLLGDAAGSIFTNPLSIVSPWYAIPEAQYDAAMKGYDRIIESNKKLAVEKNTELRTALTAIGEAEISKLGEEQRDLGRLLANNLQTHLLDELKTTGQFGGEYKIEKMDEMLGDLVKGLDDGVLKSFQSTIDSLGVDLENEDISYDEARERVTSQVAKQLKDAGFDASEAESTITLLLGLEYEMAGSVEQAREAIEKALSPDAGNKHTREEKLSLGRYSDAIGQLDQDTLGELDKFGLLDVNFGTIYGDLEDNLFNGKNIVEMFRGADGEINSIAGALNTYELALRKIEEAQSDDMKDYWKNVANSAQSAVNISMMPTFAEARDLIQETSDDFDKLNSLVSNLGSSSGQMTGESLAQLFDVFAQFEDVSFANIDNLNAWNNALTQVSNGISLETGQLQLNASAMSGLSNMTAALTQAKYQDMVTDIKLSQAQADLTKRGLEAEKTAIDTEIARIEAQGEAKFNASQTETNIAEALTDNLNKLNMEEVSSTEGKMNAMIQTTSKGYNTLLALQRQYAAGEIGDVSLSSFADQYGKTIENFKSQRVDNIKLLIDEKGGYNEVLNTLKAYSNQLGEQIYAQDSIIKNGDVLLSLIGPLSDGTIGLADVFGEAEEATSDYNATLKETLTLMEKLAGLEHTITENEKFKSMYDGYDGEAYGRLLASNLELSKQEYEVQKDLFDLQQKRVDQAAGDLLDSPYGHLFDISETGDIGFSENGFSIYDALPGDMQEDIDGLVEAFQEERDALRQTEKDLIGYAEATRAAREELVAMEIEIENALLEAIKNRESILHNARMKALDDEISMIEEAIDARKEAREDDSDEKELYEAQEALRRATLDSSGKNNASLLQLQQDLEDKQLEISEKRFERDMEDRIQWLNDTKDAETETFEYRLETMTWYWETVKEIQETGQEAMMQTLIMWNEEYRTQSALQQDEMEREWLSTMEAMKSAADMGVELDKLTADIVDSTLAVENMNIKVQALPGTWQKATDAANAYTAAASKASSVKYGGYTPTYSDTDKPKPEAPKTEEREEKNRSRFRFASKVASREQREDGGVNQVRTYRVDNIEKDGNPHSDWNNWVFGSSMSGRIVQDMTFLNGNWYYDLGYKNGWVREDALVAYANGGIVDYTGPAWVDGTKTKPEAFLNPYQTEQIASLAQSLSSKDISGSSLSSNIAFGSINFNVSSMSSAEDGKRALEVFVQGANDLMAKKGIGTKLNINTR